MPKVHVDEAGAHLVMRYPNQPVQRTPLDEAALRRLITECEVALTEIGEEPPPLVRDLIDSFCDDPKAAQSHDDGLNDTVAEEVARAFFGAGARDLHHRDTQMVEEAAKNAVSELGAYLKTEWIS
jgi:hypothetical protein